MKKLIVMMAVALVFKTFAFSGTDGDNYSEQAVPSQYLLSDGLPSMLYIKLVWSASAGTDATNSWLTIKQVKIDGTNTMEVVVYYPASWTSGAFQTSSDISNSNNWRGIMRSEQLVPKEYSLFNELPMWTKWTMKIDGVIGSRCFKLVKQ